MTIKIEFPADNVNLARIFGEALLQYSGAAVNFTKLAEETKPAPKKKEPTPSQKAFAPKEPTPSIFDTAPVVEEPAPVVEPEPEPEPEPTVKNDANGVPFDEKYCTDVVVKSGKNKGQWKPNDEVSPAEFRRWYATQVPAEEEVAKPVKRARKTVSEAGRKIGPVEPPVGQPAVKREEIKPHDCATLMAWISDRQALGFLTQEDFSQACSALNLTVRDLFPPVPEDEIKARISKLEAYLRDLCDD